MSRPDPARAAPAPAALEARDRPEPSARPERLEREEMAELLAGLLAQAQARGQERDRILEELEALAGQLRALRSEMLEIQPRATREIHLQTANDELDAVVAATEAATNRILDAAEIVEGVAGEAEGESGARLGEATTQIYEACNFQDLSGQRIAKVVQAMRHVETTLDRILACTGAMSEAPAPKVDSGPETGPAPGTDADSDPGADPDPDPDDLLNGPASPGAADQADIDRLLAELDQGGG